MNEEMKRSKRPKNSMLQVGIAIGTSLGIAIGTATENLALGLGIGLSLGCAFGSLLSPSQCKSESETANSDQLETASLKFGLCNIFGCATIESPGLSSESP